MKPLCINCDNPKFAKSYCKACYDKWYRTTSNGIERRKQAQEKIRKTAERKEYTKKYNENYKSIKNFNRNLRSKTDIQFKLSKNLRSRVYHALKNRYKAGSAIKDVGCEVEELKIYIESKFQPGMTWDNYGRKAGIKCWEIDHIFPLAKVDLTDREQFLRVCHYTNLQPLWAEDNNRKRANII